MKKLLILSPLLLTSVTQNLRCMEKITKEEITTEEPTVLTEEQKAEKQSLLNALNQHRVFVQKRTTDAQAAMDEELNLLKLAQQNDEQDADKKRKLVSQEHKEALNGHISAILGNTSTTNSETTTTTTAKTGFNWWITMKSYTHNPADLLLYTLSQEMFESDNADHIQLLEKGINYCVDNKAHTALLQILKLSHKKDIMLTDETFKKTNDFLTQTKNDEINCRLNTFTQLALYQQAILKAAIEKIQKEHAAALEEAIKSASLLNTTETAFKQEVTSIVSGYGIAQSRLEKLTLQALDSSIAPTHTWKGLLKEYNKPKHTIAQATQTLKTAQTTMEALSKLLTIEDAQQ